MKRNVLLVVALFAFFATSLVAQIPATINLQGLLLDNDGKPAAGAIEFQVDIYDVVTGGTPIHSETINHNVVDGYYSLRIGVAPNTIAFTADKDLWYEITIAGNSLGRKPFDAVPFALGSKFAEEADTAKFADTARAADVAKPVGPAGGILEGDYPNPQINEDALNAAIEAAIPSLDIKATPIGPAGGDLTGLYPNPVIADRRVKGKHIDFNAVDTEHLALGAVALDRLKKPFDNLDRNQLTWWNKNNPNDYKWENILVSEFFGGLKDRYVPYWDSAKDAFSDAPIFIRLDTIGYGDIETWVNILPEATGLDVAKNLRVGETATITGNTTITAGDLTVNVGTTYLRNTEVNGTLDVAGATTIDNTLDVSGATTLGSTLNVVDATTLGSTLDVAGATTIDNTLDVSGATTLGSTLDVAGATTIDNTLEVTGTTTLYDDLTVNANSILNGTLYVDDAVTLNSTLDVAGATTLNDDLTVNANSILNGTLYVDDATTLNSTLDVNDATVLNSTLDVIDATTLGSTLDVTGVTTLNDDLTVDGIASYTETIALPDNHYMPASPTWRTFTSLGWVDNKTRNINTVSPYQFPVMNGDPTPTYISSQISQPNDNNIIVEADFNVKSKADGATYFWVDNADGSMTSGNADIKGTLDVSGATTIDNTLDVNDATVLNSTLDVIDSTRLGGTLEVTGLATFNGSAVIPAGKVITITDLPNVPTDGANKQYVDERIDSTTLDDNMIPKYDAYNHRFVGSNIKDATFTLGSLTTLSSDYIHIPNKLVISPANISTLAGISGYANLIFDATSNANYGLRILNSLSAPNNNDIVGLEVDVSNGSGENTAAYFRSAAGMPTVMIERLDNGLALEVTGKADIYGNTSIDGTLGVSGATTLAGLTAGTTTLNSLGVTTNATVGGTLGVTGATTLTGALTANGGIGTTTLTTSGLATLNSLDVTTNATVGGTLGVTGATTLAALTAGTTTLTGALNTGANSITTTGAVNAGTVTATGAVNAGTVIATGTVKGGSFIGNVQTGFAVTATTTIINTATGGTLTGGVNGQIIYVVNTSGTNITVSGTNIATSRMATFVNVGGTWYGQ